MCELGVGRIDMILSLCRARSLVLFEGRTRRIHADFHNTVMVLSNGCTSTGSVSLLPLASWPASWRYSSHAARSSNIGQFQLLTVRIRLNSKLHLITTARSPTNVHRSSMLHLRSLRNRPSSLQHPRRHYHAPNRDSPHHPPPHIYKTKAHSVFHLRYGRLYHRRRYLDEIILLGTRPNIVRVHELVLSRGFRRSIRHKYTHDMAIGQGRKPVFGSIISKS